MPAAVSDVWVDTEGICFKVGLKKGGPKSTIYLGPPLYINGLRLAIGSSSRGQPRLSQQRIFFEHFREQLAFLPVKRKRLYLAAFETVKQLLLACSYSAGI